MLYKVGDIVQVSDQGRNNGFYQVTMEHTSSFYDYPWNSTRRWRKVVDSDGGIIKPVEIMPPGTEARAWLRTTLEEYGGNYQTVRELPFEIDSSQATTMYGMFWGCEALAVAPRMDTSQATSTGAMFYQCRSLTTVPPMDTGRVKNMEFMFSDCSSLVKVPDMNTTQVTNMSQMFMGCHSLIAAPAVDTSQVTKMRDMFKRCGSLVEVPEMDTSQVTDTSYMFFGCGKITDGNVRLIGKRPGVATGGMITKSGLTREPFYDSSGRPI